MKKVLYFFLYPLAFVLATESCVSDNGEEEGDRVIFYDLLSSLENCVGTSKVEEDTSFTYKSSFGVEITAKLKWKTGDQPFISLQKIQEEEGINVFYKITPSGYRVKDNGKRVKEAKYKAYGGVFRLLGDMGCDFHVNNRKTM